LRRRHKNPRDALRRVFAFCTHKTLAVEPALTRLRQWLDDEGGRAPRA
jgi:hypothetical protein